MAGAIKGALGYLNNEAVLDRDGKSVKLGPEFNKNDVVGLYFGANWSPECKDFLEEKLIPAYEGLRCCPRRGTLLLLRPLPHPPWSCVKRGEGPERGRGACVRSGPLERVGAPGPPWCTAFVHRPDSRAGVHVAARCPQPQCGRKKDKTFEVIFLSADV